MPNTTVLFVRKVPVVLRDRFKEAVKLREKTMQAVVIELIKQYVKEKTVKE